MNVLLPPRSEVMPRVTRILDECDNIRFSGGMRGLMDENGLNAEPLENQRDAIRELFSECKPGEKASEALQESYVGRVFLQKDGKKILTIGLYDSGFMVSGYYYEVLNPERNETMLRLLNFKKLKEKSPSP